MPGIEPEKSEMENCPQNDPVYVQPPAVREVTQTDRLNKKLLESFLQRVNETGFQIDPAEEDPEEAGND